jgi:hypothetical protein
MYGYVNVGVNPSSSLGVWAPQDDATHTQVFSLPGHILLQFYLLHLRPVSSWIWGRVLVQNWSLEAFKT